MKITIIGGAGVRTVIFINGLLKRYKKLNISEVAIYDIDKEKLNVIGKLCKHVINKKEETLNITVSNDAIEAIKGADYIVTTLRVGGDHSRVIDETTALNRGVIGQETTGVGGFSMAARTIPVLVDYIDLIKEYAKDAWVFNFSNPSGLVTQALKARGYHKIIGICDAPSSTKYRMADYLGIKEEDLYVEYFGLNHLSWIRSVKNKGKEILEELLNNDDFLESIQEFNMFDKELLRMIGYLPNEYLYYYYHREKALANILESKATRGKSIEEVNKKMFAELAETDIENEPEKALQIFLYYMHVRENSYMSIETKDKNRKEVERGNLSVPEGMGYAGVMLDCIEGMQSAHGKTLVLSVENNGAISGLEDSDVIEIACSVSQNGIIPVQIENIPDGCMQMIQAIKRYEKKAVEAIFEKSKEKAIDSIMLHPLINSYSLAKDLIEDYAKQYDNFLK